MISISIILCWFTTIKSGNWTKKGLWNWKYFGEEIFLFLGLEQWRLTLRKVRPQKILKWSFSGKGPCKKFKLGPITRKFTQNFFFWNPRDNEKPRSQFLSSLLLIKSFGNWWLRFVREHIFWNLRSHLSCSIWKCIVVCTHWKLFAWFCPKKWFGLRH